MDPLDYPIQNPEDNLTSTEPKPIVEEDLGLYPSIIVRIKAAFADTIVVIGLIIGLTTLFSKFDNVPEYVRITGVVLILLYDPIFTSFFGGTLGHIMMKIRVKQIKNLDKNIPFFNAVVRFVVKLLLGWISLLTVANNKKKLALHDMAAGSVVIYKPENN